MVHVIWSRSLSIRVLRWWWSPVPFMRAGQTVRARLMGWLMESSHVGARFSRRWK